MGLVWRSSRRVNRAGKVVEWAGRTLPTTAAIPLANEVMALAADWAIDIRAETDPAGPDWRSLTATARATADRVIRDDCIQVAATARVKHSAAKRVAAVAAE